MVIRELKELTRIVSRERAQKAQRQKDVGKEDKTANER
jgi:hypothetical protein